MRAIHFFGRKYTGTGRLAESTASVMECSVLADKSLVTAAAREYPVKESDIEKSIFHDPPLPDRFSAKKAKCIAAVRLILARELKNGLVVSTGFIGKLIPPAIGLHLLGTSSPDYRKKQMIRQKGFREEMNAENLMKKKDSAFLGWARYLQTFENLDPDHYDAVVDTEWTGLQDIVKKISGVMYCRSASISPDDFETAAEVAWVMADNGHPVSVNARDSHVDLTLHKRNLMQSRYEKKISALARSVRRVESVSVHISPLVHQADIYRQKEFVLPPERLLETIEHQYRDLYLQASGRKVRFIRKRAARESQLRM